MVEIHPNPVAFSNTVNYSLECAKLFFSFRLSKNMIRVPMLVPGLEYNFETIVECVSDLGISDQLYVFITKDKVFNTSS